MHVQIEELIQDHFIIRLFAKYYAYELGLTSLSHPKFTLG